MLTDGLLVTLAAFALGGLLKGAIGAGTPVVVVPIMTLYHDVRFAIAVFALPGLLSNLLQGWQYRRHLLERSFLLRLALSTMLGTATGTVLLATLPGDALTGAVAGMTLAYVAFRALNPDWSLAHALARRLVIPVGLASGILQGAAGISAPVSVTFLNAMRLPREVFIGTVSVFFLAMAVVQLPALGVAGILTADRLLLGLVACIPLFGAMPLGDWLGRTLGRRTFDRIIMALLVVIALRLAWAVIAG